LHLSKVTVKIDKERDDCKILSKVFGCYKERSLFLWFTTNKMLLFRMLQALKFSNWSLLARIFPNEDGPIRELDGCELEYNEFFEKAVFDNREQRKSVSYIVAGSSGSYPYILFGPPGTGKTKTIAEAIKQVHAKSSKNTIIVTAQSNCATDILAEELVKHVSKGMNNFNYVGFEYTKAPNGVLNQVNSEN